MEGLWKNGERGVEETSVLKVRRVWKNHSHQCGRQEGCERTVWKARQLWKNSVDGERAVEETVWKLRLVRGLHKNED